MSSVLKEDLLISLRLRLGLEAMGMELASVERSFSSVSMVVLHTRENEAKTMMVVYEAAGVIRNFLRIWLHSSTLSD
jgi:hypothetical protein